MRAVPTRTAVEESIDTVHQISSGRFRKVTEQLEREMPVMQGRSGISTGNSLSLESARRFSESQVC